jgi:predicted helicase
MTATPRLFDQEVKQKAEEHSAVLASMDDEASYGPEFHRLSFGSAVERGLLTDYKVLVLTIDEELIAGPLRELTFSTVDHKLSDEQIAAKWRELAGHAGTLSRRVDTPGEFVKHPGSPLAGDDTHLGAPTREVAASA